jgi:hypothetical protein
MPRAPIRIQVSRWGGSREPRPGAVAEFRTSGATRDVMKRHAAGVREFMRNKILLAAMATFCSRFSLAAELHVNELGYLDAQGLSILVYQNQFHDVFRDQKLGGIEMILHGERVATDGEVRLLSAPEQWDSVPKFTGRKRGAGADQLVAYSGYPDLKLSYRIEVTAETEGFLIAVHLDHPLPQNLIGKAGFNLDFLPTAYFGKSYHSTIRRATIRRATIRRSTNLGAFSHVTPKGPWSAEQRRPSRWEAGTGSCWHPKTR